MKYTWLQKEELKQYFEFAGLARVEDNILFMYCHEYSNHFKKHLQQIEDACKAGFSIQYSLF